MGDGVFCMGEKKHHTRVVRIDEIRSPYRMTVLSDVKDCQLV